MKQVPVVAIANFLIDLIYFVNTGDNNRYNNDNKDSTSDGKVGVSSRSNPRSATTGAALRIR